MPSFFDDVCEFHQKFGIDYDGPPRALPGDPVPDSAIMLLYEAHDILQSVQHVVGGLHRFRIQFLIEELVEYVRANVMGDLAGQLDALVDEVYVSCGTARLHGFDFNEAWRRVHAANMRKIRVEMADDSKRFSLFDVVKPIGWEPANLDDLVEDREDPQLPLPLDDSDEDSTPRSILPGGRTNPFIPEEEDEDA
jgi:predicted HAD superfamily Cof-like phosphohydrolase